MEKKKKVYIQKVVKPEKEYRGDVEISRKVQ